MFEVYIGKTEQGRKKSYFVANAPYTAVDAAKKTLKVTTAHIFVQPGWVIGEDLYLNNPKRRDRRRFGLHRSANELTDHSRS